MPKRIPIGPSDWELKPFRNPLIISNTPHECGCIWVYAPDITLDKKNPFVIKFVRQDHCREEHYKEIPRQGTSVW